MNIEIEFEPGLRLPPRSSAHLSIDKSNDRVEFHVFSLDAGIVLEYREGFVLRKEERSDGELWVVTLLPAAGDYIPSPGATSEVHVHAAAGQDGGGSGAQMKVAKMQRIAAEEKTAGTVVSQSSKLVGILGRLLKQLREWRK
jgi:hypothetical protein